MLEYGKVRIKLKNGVYRLVDETDCLYEALMGSLDEVLVFSYSDFKNNCFKLADCADKRLIFFNNYDLYAGWFEDIIKILKDSCVVILDCEYRTELMIEVQKCKIEMQDGLIVVE